MHEAQVKDPQAEAAQDPQTPNVKKEKKQTNLRETMSQAEQIEVLVHRRGLAKGKLTRIYNCLFPGEGEEPHLSDAKVRHYIKKLEAVQKEYSDLHERLILLVPAENREDHDLHYVQFDELHDDISVKLEELQARFANAALVPRAALAPAQPQAPILVHQPLMIPIPTFDGRYESWPKFKVMFKDLVDNTPDPPAVKLYHLDKALTGSAAGIIDAKTISEGNYIHAWEILEERYENKRHAIDKHIHGLLHLKRMSKGTYDELRSLLDECSKHVESLKFLQQDFVGVSESILVHVLAAALDKDIRRRWEHTVKHGDLPKYDEMMKYLKEECFTLERCDGPSTKPAPIQAKPSAAIKSSQKSFAAVTTDSEPKCEFCGKGHLNFTCSEFKGLSVQQRLAKVKECNMCFNCLKRGHRSSSCQSDKTCNRCKRRHHSLLHAEEKSKPAVVEESQSNPASQTPKNEDQQSKPPEEATSASCCSEKVPLHQVLLLTAVVDVIDKNQKTHPCRVLLDSASQVNLISKPMVDSLGLKKCPSNIVVAGVNDIKSHVSSSSVVHIRSRYSGFSANVKCLVTDKVTVDLPSSTVNIREWELPPGIQLADPKFYQTGKVDMLLGNQLFLKLLMPGEVQLANNLPCLRETQLGWVVGGVCDDAMYGSVVHSHSLTLEELNRTVQRFWEVEDVSCVQPPSEAEECEQHFLDTHRRDEAGRYIVQLPLKKNVEELSDSRSMALKRFYILERRFAQDPGLKQQYVEFMDEYERLGHCEEIKESDGSEGVKWYLPHHAVLRPSNTTTKCRVVFDASAKVKGLSLNDVMMIGSLNQCALDEINLRFRIPRYVLTTDVAKMYRQVFLEENHRRLQRVFFRLNPSNPLRVLELKTVTYGTASAPFLATRALLQLANDDGHKFPLAADIVKNCFYVDNALFGFDDMKEAQEAQLQLIQLLKAGGFHLHKWASNCEELMESIPVADREELVSIEAMGVNDVIKMLGLLWNPFTDELIFVANSSPGIDWPTKRQVLSLVASMFDPLGLAAPVVVVGKLLMKNIWSEKIDWDEKLNEELKKCWDYFLKCLSGVKKIQIPRQVVASEATAFEIHGFGDASLEAYGACVYLRSVVPGKPHVVKILTAKSKIVPKSVLTIPRKELLAALLLHRLVNKLIATLKMSFRRVVLWSDSQIVLAWLKKRPEQLEVFVKNRVCEINSNGHDFEWKYVNTVDNPADIVSRGMSAEDLATSDLWWNGPTFLRDENFQMGIPAPLMDEEVPELKAAVVASTMVELEKLPVFDKFENFRKLQRVLAYVLRFYRNCKEKDKEKRIVSTFPTITEIQNSMKVIVRVVQHQEFSEEITRLKSGESPKQLKALDPYLDDEILRVGGRLRHSKLSYSSKHQWILPNGNAVVDSFIRCVHRENLHIGPSALLATLRRQYWIVHGRSTVRKITRSCVRCFKVNPRIADQFMGDLPPSRCDRAPAFQKVGLDFAGPFLIKQTSRKAAPVKGYVCVFVCMVTKSIHLEAVENLTSDAFLAALHRFVSRRGVPEEVFSDNGTNFVGAKKELHELSNLFKDQMTEKKIFEFCQPREIHWRMIPPSSPHMGGLWEAGVKCTKSILKKTCNTASLNMMEFPTLLCEIEALLNSRPLYAHSEDAMDPEPLTPGHFLVDRPLTAIPEPTYEEIPEVQVLKALVLGEEERGQSQYQVMCFVTKFQKGDFITADAMAKLRQKNPSTIRTPEEDKGKENYTMTGWVVLDRASPISRHIAPLCSEAQDSTYARDVDLKAWAELPGSSISILESAVKPFPSVTTGSPPSRCSDVSAIWAPCICSLEMCIGWYPCGLKYCKGKPDTNPLLNGGGGGSSSYRCGIKTCRKCHQYSYYVREKQQCLWDE